MSINLNINLSCAFIGTVDIEIPDCSGFVAGASGPDLPP